MSMISFLIYTLVFGYGWCSVQVNTTEGTVEGYKANDGDYWAFYGISYGQTTDGNNRFKPPVPAAKHSGIFHAVVSNLLCLQPSPRGIIGSEDCLKLSVYTENVTVARPVIVWLNSEDYATAPTDPFTYKKFVEDVCFVQLNYRLSIFGFLCLGIEEAPGNVGLKDIVLGLKWIKANIAKFGGDPNNIVIMGHGSAGSMVDLLTMSPQAKGLFQKAVALSGSALAPWAVAYDPEGYAQLFGEKLGYRGISKEELVKRLIQADSNVLSAALNEFKFYNNTPIFAPCIENLKVNPNDTFLEDSPINILRSGNYIQVPYIAGYTSAEGTARAEQAVVGNWIKAMQNKFSDFLPVDLDLGKNFTKVASEIKNFYFDNDTVSMSTIQDYLDFEGDTLVVVSVIRGAKERSLTSLTSEVRLLEFGYMGSYLSDWIYNQVPLRGVKHGGLLNYLFNYDLKPEDDPVMNSIIKRFVAFAYTGEPNAAYPRNAPNWEAINPKNKYINYFYYGGDDEEFSMNSNTIYVEEARNNPHNITMNFWNDIISRYYKPPKSINSSNKLLFSTAVTMLSALLIIFNL